jgi:hypothetical protein
VTGEEDDQKRKREKEGAVGSEHDGSEGGNGPCEPRMPFPAIQPFLRKDE